VHLDAREFITPDLKSYFPFKHLKQEQTFP